MIKKISIITTMFFLLGGSIFSQREIGAIISGKVTVTDPISITLMPGFVVQDGSEFSAYIDASYIPPSTGTPAVITPSTSNMSFPDDNANYIRTIAPLEPMQSIDPSGAFYTVGQLSQQIQYFDGLGRPLQTIAVQASPNEKDIVQIFEYDNCGREVKRYLPFEYQRTTSDPGKLIGQSTALIAQTDFYETTLGFGANEQLYAETVFEESPLNRVLQQGAPGADWQPNKSNPSLAHSVQFNYKTNTTVINTWKFSNTAATPTYVPENYAVNSLNGFETIGEDKNKTIEYKDFTGKVIMKQSVDINETVLANKILTTLYVYDEFDLLACVVPPLANATSVTPLTANEELCYHYRYNDRKLMSEKIIPGAEKVLIYYDARDRLVLTQDGNQRNDGTGKWKYTKYDDLNRPIETGTLSNHGTLSQTEIDNIEDNISLGLVFSSSSDYSAESYTFYDSYDFFAELSSICTNSRTTSDYAYSQQLSATGYGDNAIEPELANSNIGRVTATLFKLNKPLYPIDALYDFLLTVNYYDKYDNVIQSVFDNHFVRQNTDNPDRTSTLYSFTGQEIVLKEEHDSPWTTKQTVKKEIAYDHGGRILEVTLELEGEPKYILNQNNYDNLSQLVTKRVFAKSGEHFLQKIDYKYNIRGWLTAINDKDVSGNDNDLFGMELKYNDAPIANRRYNGNIGEIDWGSSSSTGHSYNYSYDGFNRLISADYNGIPVSYDVTGITYDQNGNIKTLKRDGAEDDLTYHYNTSSNQIAWVEDPFDLQGDSEGFPQNTSSSLGYDYDSNGNMEEDLVHSVSNIFYDDNNMPQNVEYNNGEGETVYFYDITGTKHRQMNFTSSGTQSFTTPIMDYCGSFIYENKELTTILMEEGRIVKDGSDYRYEIFLNDYLGNTRVVVSRLGDGIAQLHQESHYYPFGLKMSELSRNYSTSKANRYLYNGKEQLSLNDENDIFWYDYGARFYDPSLGLWMTIDQRSDDFYQFSPYNYCLNNPLLFIDPDGNGPEETPYSFGKVFKQMFVDLMGADGVSRDQETSEMAKRRQEKAQIQVQSMISITDLAQKESLKLIAMPFLLYAAPGVTTAVVGAGSEIACGVELAAVRLYAKGVMSYEQLMSLSMQYPKILTYLYAFANAASGQGAYTVEISDDLAAMDMYMLVLVGTEAWDYVKSIVKEKRREAEKEEKKKEDEKKKGDKKKKEEKKKEGKKKEKKEEKKEKD